MTSLFDHDADRENVTSSPDITTNGSSFGFHPDLQVRAERVIPIIL